MPQFQIISTLSDWNDLHSAIKTYLGIPTGLTTEYAKAQAVDNPENADFGKFPFIVMETGSWKCNDQFDPNDLVDYDPTWFLTDPL